MECIHEIDAVRNRIQSWRQAGETIGFVPTMGYLHEGHLSLIRQAVKNHDRVIVSIFVNPMQFGPTEDLSRYPRDFDRDSALCRDSGVDLIFHPEAETLYPQGFASYVDVTGVTERLCGRSREGHFRGVCTVVTKLFQIVQPDAAYFGQKDAQQLAVIRRMVLDLNMPIAIVGCPIVREADGLAMSSRNQYLSPQERKAALCLSSALSIGRRMILAGETDAVKVADAVREHIEAEPLAKVEYVEIVDPDTIQPMQSIVRPVLCAVAAVVGSTRLIDNFILD